MLYFVHLQVSSQELSRYDEASTGGGGGSPHVHFKCFVFHGDVSPPCGKTSYLPVITYLVTISVFGLPAGYYRLTGGGWNHAPPEGWVISKD